MLVDDLLYMLYLLSEIVCQTNLSVAEGVCGGGTGTRGGDRWRGSGRRVLEGFRWAEGTGRSGWLGPRGLAGLSLSLIFFSRKELERRKEERVRERI